MLKGVNYFVKESLSERRFVFKHLGKANYMTEGLLPELSSFIKKLKDNFCLIEGCELFR